MSPEQWAALLENRHAPTYGAFDGSTLIGIGALSRSPRPKMRHRVIVSGMYVSADVRGRGAGRAILEALLAHAATWEAVEDVTLAVTVGNDAARSLYMRAGFSVYGQDPRILKVGHRHYDLEWMIRPVTQEGAGS
jgi:ribosomal protein S18 acetylase RimI-like enzyme